MCSRKYIKLISSVQMLHPFNNNNNNDNNNNNNKL